MHVVFKSSHPHASGLRHLCERRARFVLRRLGWLVPTAEVHLSGVDAPRGGADRRCQVVLKTADAGSVVVSSVAKDWRTALEQALGRAARYLMRLWRRDCDARSTRPRLLGLQR